MCCSTLDVEESELLEEVSTAGQFGITPGEVTMEVRPQYCTFSSQGLKEKLRKMGLFETCLPWVANTGRHYYTSGFKITQINLEEFKANNGGKIPDGFFTVRCSRKMN